MDNRAYLSGAAGCPPAYPSDAASGYPLTATTTLPATVPGPYWFHMIGEEVRYLIQQTGQVPDPYNSGQMLQGILNMIGEI